MTLPTIVQRLQKKVNMDWEGTTVVVSATDQDLVQIAFHMATVDAEKGVNAYMGVLAKDVDLLGQLGLRKVSQLWGMKRDFSAEVAASGGPAAAREHDDGGLDYTWMFFLLMPKWVRMRPTDAYYTVHPRSQGSAFRMSTAGSSVLLSLGAAVAGHEETARRKDPQHVAPVSARGRQAHAGSNSQLLPGERAARLELSLIEKAVSALPAIKEGRGSL